MSKAMSAKDVDVREIGLDLVKHLVGHFASRQGTRLSVIEQVSCC
jgi:hypothetical protein